MVPISVVCKLVSLLLLLSSASSSQLVQGQDEVEIISSVIVGLSRYFKSRCVYLTETSFMSKRSRRTILNTQKHLSDNFIRSAVLDIKSVGNNDQLTLEGCVTPLYACVEDVDTRTYLRMISETEAFPGKVWLLFLNDFFKLHHYFLNVNIPFNCEFIVASLFISKQSIRLTEVYRLAKYLPLQKYEFGSWNKPDGLKLPKKSFYERRNHLNGVVLRTIVNNWAPLANVNYVGSGNRLEMSGFFGNVLEIMKSQFLFGSEFTIPEDGMWGTLQENDSWDGMMGALVRNESDMAGVGLVMTAERVDFVDFTIPLFMNYLHIHIRQPRPNMAPTLQDLTSPFSAELWLALVVIAGILSAILVLVQDDRHSTVIMDVVIQVFSAIFCQQGMVIRHEAISKRIVMFLIYLIGIVSITSYSCFVISSLTIYRPEMPFDSLSGFLDDGSYSLGMLKNGYLYQEFKHAHKTNHKLMQLAYDKHVTPDSKNTPSTDEEGFQRVCDYRYAFICEEESLLMSTNLNCDVISLKHHFAKSFISYAFPKNSPYVDLFNHKILRLIQSGILKKFYKDSFKNMSKAKRNFEYASFETVVPILSVWVAGVVVSLLLLACEILVKNRG